jgi:hypothetical protein
MKSPLLVVQFHGGHNCMGSRAFDISNNAAQGQNLKNSSHQMPLLHQHMQRRMSFLPASANDARCLLSA